MVTGASSGIGKATARILANHGIRVILVARRLDLLDELKSKLDPLAPCHVMACDLTDRRALQAQLDLLPEAFSEVDILVNSAGLALGLHAAQETEWQDWATMLSVNCVALSFLTHHFLPDMVTRDCGHIVNIGSIAGTYPYQGGNVYGATKAFVEQFTLNLKADLLGTSIRVTNIEPGMVQDTEFSLVRFKGDEGRATGLYQGIEALKPDDIAENLWWVLAQPAHVNINRIEMMPVNQAPARPAYCRNGNID